ncbi:MAG TPA: hypothetical protein VMC83_19995 [Streptosporangiaceae bacterium]|nr:hypothetical protein [Streptosporangiaceae bacterium]
MAYQKAIVQEPPEDTCGGVDVGAGCWGGVVSRFCGLVWCGVAPLVEPAECGAAEGDGVAPEGVAREGGDEVAPPDDPGEGVGEAGTTVLAWPGVSCAKTMPSPSEAAAAVPTTASEIALVRPSNSSRRAAAQYSDRRMPAVSPLRAAPQSACGAARMRPAS